MQGTTAHQKTIATELLSFSFAIFFHKEPVGPFKLESTARVVSSPISVLSTEQNTQVVNVPNRLHKPDPISVLKAHEEELNTISYCILTQYLIEGFSLGFRISFVGERYAMDSPNLKSALERSVVTSAKLQKECDARRIVGPFATPPFSNFRSSPIGLVPKKDPSEFRLIHHLSYPQGTSVNDFIPNHYSTVKYASVGDATKSIQRLGRGCFMAKTDVKSAFRIIPYAGTICVTLTGLLPWGCLVLVLYLNPLAPPLNGYP